MDTSRVPPLLEGETWTLHTSHKQSVLLIWCTLAVQYLRLSVGGTAIEQGRHNFYVPPLTSDKQRRGSIRLQDGTAGERCELSFGKKKATVEAPITQCHGHIQMPPQLESETWTLNKAATILCY